MSASWQDRKQYVDVLGKRMAYVEQGAGRPIVLLHGNPTSSFLWRNVAAELDGIGRCVMPDLIGMGDSDKLDPTEEGRYTFVRHREFLDGFLDALGLNEDLLFVIHDWGSGLGFDWIRRHPGAVRGVAYMESLVSGFTWDEWPEAYREIFQAMWTPAGEEIVIEDNLFVEAILPGAMLRILTEEELDEYRRPFRGGGEDRRPMLTWPRQIPFHGEPADVAQIVVDYGRYLRETPGLPKLFVNGDPGGLLVGPQRDFCRSWPDQEEVTVAGIHYLQEDSGAEIGGAIAEWAGRLK